MYLSECNSQFKNAEHKKWLKNRLQKRNYMNIVKLKIIFFYTFFVNVKLGDQIIRNIRITN